MRSISKHATETFHRGRTPHPPSFEDRIDQPRVELVRSDESHGCLHRWSSAGDAEADPGIFAPASDTKGIAVGKEVDRPAAKHIPGANRSLLAIFARGNEQLFVCGESLLEGRRERQADAAMGRR